MLDKTLENKLIDILLDSAKQYIQKDFSEIIFPENIEIFLQNTKNKSNGDISSNIAMKLTSIVKKNPVEISESIINILQQNIKSSNIDLIEKIDSKNGFINFCISNKYFYKELINIFQQKDNFGKSNIGKNQKVNIEFVSANPTGPLTIAHGRQAAIGDTLSRILKFAGYNVTNEYYLNDCGRQIKLLGKSLAIRYYNLCGNNKPMIEDGYIGDYIIDIAKDLKDKKGEGLITEEIIEKSYIDFPEEITFFCKYSVDYILELIKKDLEDFGVNFDIWTSQKNIEENNEVENILNILNKKGYIYKKEEATWFASTKFNDDKDRVVIKSNGSKTYLAPDIAYHNHKYNRGYEKIIDILGPDHHGYINRMKAAIQALGYNKDSLDILIIQLVTLIDKGKVVSMSTRKGEFITLRELIDELGKDVTRFFFLSRRLDSHLDFDIELAKKQSADNPVFYIQYAHARICSIKRKSDISISNVSLNEINLELLDKKEEKNLICKLLEFPLSIESSAIYLEPNKLVTYLTELSKLFHSFYNEYKVITEDIELTKSRLFLVECIKIVLINGLKLLNIDFPEEM